MEYSSLLPHYSAASTGSTTSDSCGHSRVRSLRLHRRSSPGKPANYGFSLRGGREHGTGFFVSSVELGSEAHCQGLRVGDQIVRVNGFPVEDAIHNEVQQLIKSQNHLHLKVRTVGMIPVKDKPNDPLTWRLIEDQVPLLPASGKTSVLTTETTPVCNLRDDTLRDVRLFLSVAPKTKLGCGICKGPEWKPGIFVQFTKEKGLAREAGLRPGDQIIECNNITFKDISFNQAVHVLKSARQLDLVVRKGAGLDLFPGESSGYNSSSSSVNGDQSPSWEDTKRLSIVKEESMELEERLGQLESSHRLAAIDKSKQWDQIEYEWDTTEVGTTRGSRGGKPLGSCCTVIRVEENDGTSLTESQELEEKVSLHGTDNSTPKSSTKLAEICMISQQLETTTVVVEVHRSEAEELLPIKNTEASLEAEVENNQDLKRNLIKSPSNSSFASSAASSSASSSLSSAISQELQRRSQRLETDCHREEGRKKDILKTMDDEKRQQHAQLMEEFKKAHRKMFAQTLIAENNGSKEHLKLGLHNREDRESFREKRQQKEVLHERKMCEQRALVAVKERVLRMDRDRQDTAEAEREVTRMLKKTTSPPPPPPPMPPDETDSDKSSVVKSSSSSSMASSCRSTSSAPPCPTPDYDTTSIASSNISLPRSVTIITKSNPTTTSVNFTKSNAILTSVNITKSNTTSACVNVTTTSPPPTQVHDTTSIPKPATVNVTKKDTIVNSKCNHIPTAVNISHAKLNLKPVIQNNTPKSVIITRNNTETNTKAPVNMLGLVKPQSAENASQNSTGNIPDSVEMQSLESFKLNNPAAPNPKPPPTYFVPTRNNKDLQKSSPMINQTTYKDPARKNKPRPVSVTIGEYSSGVERRLPSRFDFLSMSGGNKSTSQQGTSPIGSQLQSELVQTLSRSNLKKKTESQENLTNESSNENAAKGRVTILVNSQMSNGEYLRSSRPKDNVRATSQVVTDKITSNGVSIIAAESRTQLSSAVKATNVQSAAEKIACSLTNNNRVTIKVANGNSVNNSTDNKLVVERNIKTSQSNSSQPNGILKNGTSLIHQGNNEQHHRTIVHQKSITFGEITTVCDQQPPQVEPL